MTQLSNIRKNIMGTTSFDLKIKGMRKPQDFIVYNIAKGNDSKQIKIQSDSRIGLLSLESGKGKMSKSHQGGAFFHHLQLDNLTEFEVCKEDLQLLKEHIFKTASKRAGNKIMTCDNSGAVRVL